VNRCLNRPISRFYVYPTLQRSRPAHWLSTIAVSSTPVALIAFTPEWAYGLPELNPQNRTAIAEADRVSNPGCYPQGFILSILPLIEAGLLNPSTPLRCNAVSGYSGGGRQMIESFEDFTPEQADTYNTQTYGLTQGHKHLPEMQHYSGTTVAPIFLPTVANYYKGMVTSVALFASELSGATPAKVQAILEQRYADERFIRVAPVNAEQRIW
jgi:N-acetyl-gamma-glutamyl-phosphate reductase